jgi:hypothetical protein
VCGIYRNLHFGGAWYTMYVEQFKMTKWCETKWSNFLASFRFVGGVICKYVVQSQVIE